MINFGMLTAMIYNFVIRIDMCVLSGENKSSSHSTYLAHFFGRITLNIYLYKMMRFQQSFPLFEIRFIIDRKNSTLQAPVLTNVQKIRLQT